MSTSMEHDSSVFFKLPQEIRTAIYKLVLKKETPFILTGEDDVYVNPAMDGKLVHFTEEDCRQSKDTSVLRRKVMEALTESPAPLQQQKPLRHVALLAVCSQINVEATPVLYTANILLFDVHSHNPLVWLDRVGENARHMKRLTLWVGHSLVIDPRFAADLLRWPINPWIDIKRVTALIQSRGYDPDPSELQLEEACGKLLRCLEWWAYEKNQRSVDIGFFRTLAHACSALSDQY
ncbi:hypothetical protein F4677DRAFT_419911 [Hypoxylon crocopeplum]|nr:hypothetical protein F4677DRAFT_419911 [Hypoxylon crocopeplum]